MGVSTNGIIAFGVACEEDTEFPWAAEEFDGDIEDWWRKENGFNDIYQPWTSAGDYAKGWNKDDPRFDEYFQHRNEWLKANPVPVEMENYCSGDCPMYAITVPHVGLSCRRGYPESFDPKALVVTDEQVAALMSFLVKYKIEYTGEPGWLLMSYWG